MLNKLLIVQQINKILAATRGSAILTPPKMSSPREKNAELFPSTPSTLLFDTGAELLFEILVLRGTIGIIRRCLNKQ
jgi:hypothetical protein